MLLLTEEEEQGRRRRRRSEVAVQPSSSQLMLQRCCPRRASTGADFRATGSSEVCLRLRHRGKPLAEAGQGGEERAKQDEERRRETSTLG